MSKLKRIGVQNFQVFREFTEIPLAELTLFFGPNSAGKSAVFDALDVLLQVMSPPEWSGRGGPFDKDDPELRRAILERHWRREGGDVFADGPMRLVAQVDLSGNLTPRPEGDPLSQDKRVREHRRDTDVQSKDRVVLLDVSFPASTWSSSANAEEHVSGPTLRVFVDGSLVYMHEDGGFVFVALDHSYVHELFPGVAEDEDAWRLAESPYLQLMNGGAAVVADVAYSGGFRLMLPERVLDESDDYQTEQLHRFAELHDSLTAHLQHLCTLGLRLSRVEASRGVPTPKDLTYVVEKISPRHPLGGVIEHDAGDLSATGIYRPPRSRHKPARARPAARSRSRHIPASA